MKYFNRGDAHTAIIIIIVMAVLGALGFVFYTNFIAKKSDTSTTTSTNKEKAPSVKASSITAVVNTDMLRYTNNDLGFQFDFPKQTEGSVGCHATNKWSDNYGNQVDAPVTLFVVDSGVADMTVLEGKNTFTIAQKRAPVFTSTTYGSEQRQYNDSCKMSDVTQALLEANDVYTSSEWRAWQVYKLASVDEIAEKARELKMLGAGTKASKINYTLGRLANGRQEVTYDFYFSAANDDFVGGGATKTWYYPDQKLLVHIGLGQSLSFAKPDSPDSYYIDQIVDSFKVLK